MIVLHVFCGACVMRIDEFTDSFCRCLGEGCVVHLYGRTGYSSKAVRIFFIRQHVNIVLAFSFVAFRSYPSYLLCGWHTWPDSQIIFVMFISNACCNFSYVSCFLVGFGWNSCAFTDLSFSFSLYIFAMVQNPADDPANNFRIGKNLLYPLLRECLFSYECPQVYITSHTHS